MVNKIVVEKVKTCDIHSPVGHPTNMCPILQKEYANTMGGFLGQGPYDPYSNTLTLGWGITVILVMLVIMK